MKTIAETIKEARLAKGWTCYRLAKECGVQLSLIIGLERGTRPRVDTLQKVVRALGISITIE